MYYVLYIMDGSNQKDPASINHGKKVVVVGNKCGEVFWYYSFSPSSFDFRFQAFGRKDHLA